MHNEAPLLLLAVILFSAGVTAFFMPIMTTETEIRQDAEDYATLRKQLSTSDQPMLTRVTDGRIELDGEQASTTLPLHTDDVASVQRYTDADLAACKAANADFIGWLQIPNTTVDYPVVRSDDTDYYLSHTFTGQKSYIGTLFSLLKTDFQAPSRNIAIYGHHIRSNAQVMFSPLTDYKEQSFYADHATFCLDTLYHAAAYKVFAVLNMRNGDWEPSIADFNSDAEFLAFVNRAKTLSLYDTNVGVKATDRILTLITCDRSFGGKEGRLIVMAVEQP